MSHKIEVEFHSEAVVQLTVTDAARENQLCWAAVDELAQRLREACDKGGRIVVLASGLEGYWLQHAWLRDLANGVKAEPLTGTGMGWFEVQEMLTGDQMVSIAAISGDSCGGGAELGWACDLRIAEAQARFAQPEINMGLTTGIGGCSRLARLAGRAVAAEMVLTGRPMSAERLYNLGALNSVVASGEAVSTALAVARRLESQSPEALSGIKKILNRCTDVPLEDALRWEQEVFQSVVAGEAALDAMERVQQSYDAGATVAEANHYDSW